MNDENHAECQKLVTELNCHDIITLESCPLQFRCFDNSNGGDSHDSTTSHHKSTSSASSTKDTSSRSISKKGNKPYQCPSESECVDAKGIEDCQKYTNDGCLNVIMSKSCPAEFFCIDDVDVDTDSNEDASEDSEEDGSTDTYECPPADDSCMNDENHKQCVTLVKDGCQQIFTLEKCPVVFGCNDDNQNNNHNNDSTESVTNEDSSDAPSDVSSTDVPTSDAMVDSSSDVPSDIGTSTDVPISVSTTDYVCPLPDTDCMTEDNYQECQKLLDDGCINVISPTRVCPLQFKCGDLPDDNDNGDDATDDMANPDNDGILGMPATYVCPLPENDPCIDDTNYALCQSLLSDGCIDIGMTKSCPAHFICVDSDGSYDEGGDEGGDDEDVEGDEDTSSSSFECRPPSSDPCMNDTNYGICTELVAEGCRSIIASKSCPMTFGCADVANADNNNDNDTNDNDDGKLDPPTPSTTYPPFECPPADDPCMTPESYEQCQKLIDDGCSNLISTMACPGQYSCADVLDVTDASDEEEDEEKTSKKEHSKSKKHGMDRRYLRS